LFWNQGDVPHRPCGMFGLMAWRRTRKIASLQKTCTGKIRSVGCLGDAPHRPYTSFLGFPLLLCVESFALLSLSLCVFALNLLSFALYSLLGTARESKTPSLSRDSQ
jgi:hypothetical protein